MTCDCYVTGTMARVLEEEEKAAKLPLPDDASDDEEANGDEVSCMLRDIVTDLLRVHRNCRI